MYVWFEKQNYYFLSQVFVLCLKKEKEASQHDFISRFHPGLLL
jgi:hypothetical protein